MWLSLAVRMSCAARDTNSVSSSSQTFWKFQRKDHQPKAWVLEVPAHWVSEELRTSTPLQTPVRGKTIRCAYKVFIITKYSGYPRTGHPVWQTGHNCVQYSDVRALTICPVFRRLLSIWKPDVYVRFSDVRIKIVRFPLFLALEPNVR